ncbi:MAG: hypothetical protein ACREBF_04755 [Candidatus Micrarchaeales archaeon]
MSRFYYDTSVFAYFLFRNDWEHQYSPTKREGYSTVLCDEELIFGFMKGHFEEWREDHTFAQVVEKLFSVRSIFQPHDLNVEKDIRPKFMYVMGSLAQNNVDVAAEWSAWNRDKSCQNRLTGWIGSTSQ